MRTSFSPKQSKATAKIVALANVSANLFRFRAQVSSNLNRKVAVSNALAASGLGLITSASFVVKSGATPTVEGFALATPMSKIMASSELASTLKEMGVKEVAKNMYMDSDEIIWHVSSIGDDVVIQKDSNGEVEALLASVAKEKDSTFSPLIDDTSDVGTIAYVADNGLIDTGIVFANVAGRPTHSKVLSFEDIEGEPIEVANAAVIAYDELTQLDEEQDFENIDPVDYFRIVYSKDPEMVNSLKTLTQNLVAL